MTKEEFLKSDEFITLVNRISEYPSGFKFTLYYCKMTKQQKLAFEIVERHCTKRKIIKSISFDLDIKGNIVSETFIRL